MLIGKYVDGAELELGWTVVECIKSKGIFDQHGLFNAVVAGTKYVVKGSFDKNTFKGLPKPKTRKKEE